MTHLTQSLSFLSEYVYRITVWFEELTTEYKRARDISNTIKELNALSDKDLRDIGISRGMIWDIAHKTYGVER